jgi:hypothetical protein
MRQTDRKRKARRQGRAREIGTVRRGWQETEKRADRQSKVGRQAGKAMQSLRQPGKKRVARRGKLAGLGRKADKEAGRGRQA